MLKIGSLVLKNALVLAPMAGITDAPFRKIVKEFDPGLVCGEMTSGMALHYNSKPTRALLEFDPAEQPISLQIFGSDPQLMAEAALMVEATGADIIDINMGCPVPKVVKNGEGAALLNNLALAKAIIAAVVMKVKVPVTVKCRLGWDRDHIMAPELAKIAEECGAAAIAVHARTRDQFYQGKANWDEITPVKQSVSIPVIGNGDVNSPQAALEIIKRTGCDGVMIGRGCLGKPWIFKQVGLFLDQGAIVPDPSFAEKLAIMFRHLELQINHSGEERGIKEMRKHLAWYLKGRPGAAKTKEKINHLTSFKAVQEALLEYAAGLEPFEPVNQSNCDNVSLR
jgi:nifR3 family TIM-barrel protein